MCMNVRLHVCLYTVCVWGGPQRAPDPLKLGFQMIQAAMRCWELNLGPLEEQGELLIIELSSHSFLILFNQVFSKVEKYAQ